MEQLSLQRKGEIALILVKKELAKKGISLGGSSARDIGNLAKRSGVSKNQIWLFIREVYAELYQETFQEKLVEEGPDPFYERDAPLDEKIKHKIAINYITGKIGQDGMVFDKERFSKSMADVSEKTGIGKEELMLFAKEIAASLYWNTRKATLSSFNQLSVTPNPERQG